jgi:branched-chain amino acid transport system ATP-binding protein
MTIEPVETSQPSDPTTEESGRILLQVDGLVAGYDGSRVVDNVSLTVHAGEAVALLGRNGVGKTTLIESIMGMVRPSAGRVVIDGRDVCRRPPHVVSRAGVAIIPQGRRIFAPLTVAETLAISQRKGGDWSVADVYDLMPRLAERRSHLGSQLSGGEQQMLSIGRAMLCSPKLVLLDEPSDGLAPAVVEQVADIVRTLAESGLALLLVEQDLRLAFSVADRVMVMSKGQIVHEGSVPDFRTDEERARRLLGIG